MTLTRPFAFAEVIEIESTCELVAKPVRIFLGCLGPNRESIQIKEIVRADKCSVESYPEQLLRTECEAIAVEELHQHIPVNAQLPRQFEVDHLLSFVKESHVAFTPVVIQLPKVHSLDLVNLVIGLIAANKQAEMSAGYICKTNVPEVLDRWGNDDTVEKSLEIVDVPHLTGLAYAFSIGEPLETVELSRLESRVDEACVHEQTAASGARSTFA